MQYISFSVTYLVIKVLYFSYQLVFVVLFEVIQGELCITILFQKRKRNVFYVFSRFYAKQVTKNLRKIANILIIFLTNRTFGVFSYKT